jgi:23S rRNA pseudouridine1911/1915/1917 synthase
MRVAVTDEQAGERLDVVLGEALGSRARAQRLIDAGRVTVDGAVRPKRHRVHAHEVIEAADDEPSRTAPVAEEAVPFVVVYEDEALLVVDKPAGVVVHPAPGHATGTLAQALGLTGRAGIVHRLDRDTSGLLVVAKTDAAHQALQRAIQRREVTREYLALVEGRPPARSGTVDAPIGRDRRARTRHSIETDTPRAAVTHFTVERLLPEHTLLRVRLETGRTHQIRVHLQAIGHPVAGDPEYGGRAGELGLRRQFLHAARLAFAHPRTGERVDLRSPLPADLCAALSRAGG